MKFRGRPGHILTVAGIPDDRGVRAVSATLTLAVTDDEITERTYRWERDRGDVDVIEVTKRCTATLSLDDVPDRVRRRMTAKRRKRSDK